MKIHGNHQAVVVPESDMNVKPIRTSLQLTIKCLPDIDSGRKARGTVEG
jgi:hypothetical protein